MRKMKLNYKEDWPLYLIILGVTVAIINESTNAIHNTGNKIVIEEKKEEWQQPSLYVDNELKGAERAQVIYGEELIANTAHYFGPHGVLQQITNGMNCQNCHLQAGAKAWGNNYDAVFTTYPRFRDRSGTVETIATRINDCFERSLNGQAIDTSSKEMQAMVAYIKWLGHTVKKGQKPEGAGITQLPYLTRAANPQKGAVVYMAKCSACHGANGEGVADEHGYGFIYPPLWGVHSYNSGAGLFRLSRFAGYIKDNMPFNQASHQSPALTDEEAWDVAAFVNTQPRPVKDISHDWPDISKKPVDHPFGPFADGFSERQHKYGPFQPIDSVRKAK